MKELTCYECGAPAEMQQFNSLKFAVCPKCNQELDSHGMPKSPKKEDKDWRQIQLKLPKINITNKCSDCIDLGADLAHVFTGDCIHA